MASRKIYHAAVAAVLLVAGWGAPRSAALAQEAAERPQAPQRVRSDEATGLEIQLHLLVARRTADGQDEKLPAALDAVVKQLRATFQFKSYRLATTLLNRVKNGGRLAVRWYGSPLFGQSPAPGSTPGSNELNIMGVKLEQDDAGRDIVQLASFNFNARITVPVPTLASVGPTAVQLENTGISTDLSVREGEPTIVGTLDVGPAGDALILVVTARRPGK
jgi:hypothetical protein